MKNLIIIFLIFVIPISAYFFMSKDSSTQASKVANGKPQLIKFSSTLCLDCKKMKKLVDEKIAPKYGDKIDIVEINVQEDNPETKKLINDYSINLVPTTIFIDKNGNQVRRVEGYIEQKDLEKYLDVIIND